MASRLKLKKKKYHPPLQEPLTDLHTQSIKTTEVEKKTNIKTYAQVASNSTKFMTSEEPKKTKTTQIKTTEALKKTNIKTYKQMPRFSTQIFDEKEIFTRVIESA